jgi:hypothetical protein
MPFQFLCPQGHLLEGDESHAGLECECPQCGAAFIIPASPGQPAADATEPAASAPEESSGAYGDLFDEIPGGAEGDIGGGGGGLLSGDMPSDVLHIPCPNGHELESPLDMLGQEVLCPQCSVQFRLRREDSVEYQRQQEIIFSRRGKIWLRWAIAAAVVVGLSVFVMMILLIVS